MDLIRYGYSGPVYDGSGNLLRDRWSTEVKARNKKKAISAMSYRYRFDCDLPVPNKIVIDPLYVSTNAYDEEKSLLGKSTSLTPSILILTITIINLTSSMIWYILTI